MICDILRRLKISVCLTFAPEARIYKAQECPSAFLGVHTAPPSHPYASHPPTLFFTPSLPGSAQLRAALRPHLLPSSRVAVVRIVVWQRH